jgi:hypothetical protein
METESIQVDRWFMRKVLDPTDSQETFGRRVTKRRTLTLCSKPMVHISLIAIQVLQELIC